MNVIFQLTVQAEETFTWMLVGRLLELSCKKTPCIPMAAVFGAVAASGYVAAPAPENASWVNVGFEDPFRYSK